MSFQAPSNLYAVILAGGSGTRLWPLSRRIHPKQLLHLPGCSPGRSLVQETARRVLAHLPPERVVVVTQYEQDLEVRRQVDRCAPEAGPRLTILVEPQGRNTAPAIAWAALEVTGRDPGALLLVMPADHLIMRPELLWGAVQSGLAAAREGYLVTFGITPDHPATGYGYIKQGPLLEAGGGPAGVYGVERFVEKPSAATAADYLSQGGYFWNSGIFLWSAASFLQAVDRWQPRLGEGLRALEFDAHGRPRAEAYGRLDNLSVDYGILEHHDRCALAPLPAGIGWTDLGSWEAVFSVAPKDPQGNYQQGEVLTRDCTGSLFLGSHRLVAGLGLTDLVVVETADAVLVAARDRVQDIKYFTDALKEAEVVNSPRTVCRPWGTFTVLEEGPGYKIKRIEVFPGAKLSLQYHHRRSEHWVVISGTARVTCGEAVTALHANESTFIPMGTPHRLENPGDAPTVIIEVQNGDYLGEDDIVRLEDSYHRVG